MLTISQLARRFGLSRSTLLYYDAIGLLSPSGRSPANYRLYSDDDVRRMERIDRYRKTGLPLAEITRILASDDEALVTRLETRHAEIEQEVARLRTQQRTIAALLDDPEALARTRELDKESWVAILRATGLEPADMQRWHVEFERHSPGAHHGFLERLGIDEPEICKIRDEARRRG